MQGKAVVLPDGKRVSPDDILGEPTPGTKLVIVGDTGETRTLEKVCHKADALVIEGTYLYEEVELAREYAHLTVREAAELAAKTRDALGAVAVRAVGDETRRVVRVALCSGSGGSLLEQALTAGVDVFVTGDIKYHDAQRAVEAGLALIDVGHFASEQLIVRPLAAFLQRQAASHRKALQILEATVEQDPFWYRVGA